jgi:hypothetical protein
MDRTSGQPQVKLSLFRSISLKIRQLAKKFKKLGLENSKKQPDN